MRLLRLASLAVALALALGLQFLLPLEEAHGDFWWHRIDGFFALFGLLICLAMMGFAKLIGHYWLQRKEDYYD